MLLVACQKGMWLVKVPEKFSFEDPANLDSHGKQANRTIKN